MDKRKGQVAVEFLMYAGLFMIIAIAAYVLISFTERGEVSLRESQLITAFGYKFATAPTICFKGGEGFTYDISFAKEIDARPYNVTYLCVDDSEGRRCQSQIAWEGSYQNFVYPYVIAPAHYTIGGGSYGCLTSPASDASLFDPEQSNGHLIFKNIGIQGSNEYPTIEIYCEVP